MGKLLLANIPIDIINSTDPLVPTSSHEPILDDAILQPLAIALKDNLACLLIGETGTAKTSMVRWLAYLRKQAYVRVNMTGYTTPDELIGSKSVKEGATYFEYGIITDAMQRGAILVLDEINATTPDCLFILHGLLDEDRRITMPNSEVVYPHDDFRVFATCNPDYEGTKSMNKAFLDRFPLIISIDTLAPDKETKLLINRTNITPDLANQLVTIATMARKDYAENKIYSYVSTRSLLHVANLIKSGLTPQRAYETAIMQKATDKQEQKVLLDFFLAIMRMAEKGDDGDIAVTVTKRELELLKQERKQSLADLENAVKKRQQIEDLCTETRGKSEMMIKVNEKLQKQLTEASKKIKTLEDKIKGYKQLEKIIKGVAKES